MGHVATSGMVVSTLFSRLLQGFDQWAIRSAGSDSERLYLPIAMEMTHKCIEKVAVEVPPTQVVKERATLVTRFDTREIFAAVGKEGFGAPPEVQTVGMISIDTYDETTSIDRGFPGLVRRRESLGWRRPRPRAKAAACVCPRP